LSFDWDRGTGGKEGRREGGKDGKKKEERKEIHQR
jgi:hypothetical protein